MQAQLRQRFHHPRVFLHQRLDSRFVGHGKRFVAFVLVGKQLVAIEAEFGAERGLHPLNLGHRHAAQQVGRHVFGFGRRRVVHVAPDVEREVVGLNRGEVHQPRVAGFLQLVGKHVVNFLDVLGAQHILLFTLGVVLIGVDNEHLVLQVVGLALVEHHHAGRNAGAVKQLRRQADDAFQHVGPQHSLPDFLFLTAPEQHSVRHHHHHLAAALAAGQHVLHKHKVGLLARFGREAIGEPLRPLHGGPVVVLRKRRVGNHPIELQQPPVLLIQRLFQRVAVLDVIARDVVQDDVHLADGHHRRVVFLPEKPEVGRVLPLFLHVLLALNQHPARARRGVVDGHARRGLYQLHQQAHHLVGRVELPALLAALISKVLEQVFIRRAQQVGKLKVLIDQRRKLVEMVNHLLQIDILDDLLAIHFLIEVDAVLEYAF